MCLRAYARWFALIVTCVLLSACGYSRVPESTGVAGSGSATSRGGAGTGVNSLAYLQREPGWASVSRAITIGSQARVVHPVVPSGSLFTISCRTDRADEWA